MSRTSPSHGRHGHLEELGLKLDKVCINELASEDGQDHQEETTIVDGAGEEEIRPDQADQAPDEDTDSDFDREAQERRQVVGRRRVIRSARERAQERSIAWKTPFHGAPQWKGMLPGGGAALIHAEGSNARPDHADERGINIVSVLLKAAAPDRRERRLRRLGRRAKVKTPRQLASTPRTPSAAMFKIGIVDRPGARSALEMPLIAALLLTPDARLRSGRQKNGGGAGRRRHGRLRHDSRWIWRASTKSG